MDETTSLAPPVVAVTVVHQPGDWFEHVLAGLARQDYPNLRFLFLVAGGEVSGAGSYSDVQARISVHLPQAFVQQVAGNPGFGPTANAVRQLVQGDNGFFCFLHDDVALEPDAIRLLVEELYRSNAGIVGPKLVSWRDPSALQHVGLGVDIVGEVDPMVEPGELDQEQHDAVRDVFAVPSACMLVRADLFRTIGGFDETIEYRGDDVDLCWRAHLSGARVVVVPSAVGRHRERLADRRPDLRLESMADRSRMRTVATLTGAGRVWWVMLLTAAMTLVESLVALLTGHVRRGLSLLAAFAGLAPRFPSHLARRAAVRPLRAVPDSEIAGLQVRGSARLKSYLRDRHLRATDPDASDERRWRAAAGGGPVLLFLAVAGAVVVASRQLIIDGVPAFGEFLPFPASPGDLLAEYRSGWSGVGLGRAEAVPTAVALLGLGSVLTLFRMGLLQTVAVLGPLVVGAWGAWRAASVFPSVRSRVSTTVVYVAVPLVAQLLASGQWSALLTYATVPWVVHHLRRISGLELARRVDAADAPTERQRVLDSRSLVRVGAQLTLVLSVAAALAPVTLVMALAVGVVLAVATLAGGGAARTALAMLVATVLATVGAFVANLPWSTTLLSAEGWTAVVGVPDDTRRLGLEALARMQVGPASFTIVTVLVLLPVAVTPLIARSWRLTWAVRGAAMVTVFGAVAVAAGRDALPVSVPSAGVLLVPVVFGTALSIGSLAAAFDADVLSGSFGWRQPLGVLAAVAAVVGTVPGVVSVVDGRWRMPEQTLADSLVQLPTDPESGDYRILWIGAPDMVPGGGWEYSDGISVAITDDGAPTVRDRWVGAPSEVEAEVIAALGQMARGETVRGGRLLAPFAIRYVVVPVADGVRGTIDTPLDPPAGLTDVLDDQLDLSSPLTRPPHFLVYENVAAVPTRSMLSEAGAAASLEAGGDSLIRADLKGALPFGTGASERGPATGPVATSTLHVAVPFDERWTLTVGALELAPRRAFGSTLAFDVPSAGAARLAHDAPFSRFLWLLAQAVAWMALVVAAASVRWSRLFPRRTATLEPVLDLTGPIARPSESLAALVASADEGGPAAPDEGSEQ